MGTASKGHPRPGLARVEPGGQAEDIADAIAIAVGEGADEYLVEDSVPNQSFCM